MHVISDLFQSPLHLTPFSVLNRHKIKKSPFLIYGTHSLLSVDSILCVKTMISDQMMRINRSSSCVVTYNLYFDCKLF